MNGVKPGWSKSNITSKALFRGLGWFFCPVFFCLPSYISPITQGNTVESAAFFKLHMISPKLTFLETTARNNPLAQHLNWIHYSVPIIFIYVLHMCICILQSKLHPPQCIALLMRITKIAPVVAISSLTQPSTLSLLWYGSR